ncbi:hypothetical protein QAD02_023728 [Eretmocerus hayati]|uniref:Uncharacterized protein n=1 Tax=Eretmocerus hayati TaxID=131215 RepID=A0ACC2PXT1_9HYME|nr:hypothetical protein QAD02_023728 [Eretmocerus hayati]
MFHSTGSSRAELRPAPDLENNDEPPSGSTTSNHTLQSRCACSPWHITPRNELEDDDPPPYASLVQNHHHQQANPELHQQRSWAYAFPNSESHRHAAVARPLVSIPLTSYGIFKIEPPCYAVATQQQPLMHQNHLEEQFHQQMRLHRVVEDSGQPPPFKGSLGSSRKYNAILKAAMVIFFLMALSLMVRFVTEKSLWKR